MAVERMNEWKYTVVSDDKYLHWLMRVGENEKTVRKQKEDELEIDGLGWVKVMSVHFYDIQKYFVLQNSYQAGSLHIFRKIWDVTIGKSLYKNDGIINS